MSVAFLLLFGASAAAVLKRRNSSVMKFGFRQNSEITLDGLDNSEKMTDIEMNGGSIESATSSCSFDVSRGKSTNILDRRTSVESYKTKVEETSGRGEGPRNVKLLCYMLVKNDSREVGLLHAQKELGDGIFDCDKHVIYSTVSDLAGIASVPLYQNFTASGAKKRNTNNFIEAYHRMFADDALNGTDWVVKADPDTVWSASRLRQQLASVPPDFGGYFLNGKDDRRGATLYGWIEIVSTKAMDLYRSRRKVCEFKTRDDREDAFLRECLHRLNVTTMDRRDICQKQSHFLKPADCAPESGNPNQIAFHSFKSELAWRECWRNMHSP